MRYAIWAAVSTKRQVGDDKFSINDQIEKGRTAGEQRQWGETSGPFIIPGESRTRFVNLDDARRQIAALDQMLLEAEAGAFDVLVVYSYDRLGDLADMIATELSYGYGIQLFSVTQPAEPAAPEEFDPSLTDVEPMLRDAAKFYQRIRVAALRRYYRTHLPKRVERGLHAFTVPFGYERTNGKKPGVVVPEEAAVVIKMKDMFLAGASYREIARMANASGVSPKRGGEEWDYTTIRKMLINPYYAGYVVWGRMRTRFDIRTRKQTQKWKPREEWKIEEGLHEPLWSHEEYDRIMEEYENRSGKNRRFRARYPFSGLLVCGVCGKVLRRIANAGKESVHWRCYPPPDHIRAREDVITRRVVLALMEEVGKRQVVPVTKEEVEEQTSGFEAAITRLKAQRERVRDAYERGEEMYSYEEASKKIKEIDREIDDIEDKIAEVYKRAHDSLVQSETFQELGRDVSRIPRWIEEADPREVHRVLSHTFSQIIITPDINKSSRDETRLKVEFV